MEEMKNIHKQTAVLAKRINEHEQEVNNKIEMSERRARYSVVINNILQRQRACSHYFEMNLFIFLLVFVSSSFLSVSVCNS